MSLPRRTFLTMPIILGTASVTGLSFGSGDLPSDGVTDAGPALQAAGDAALDAGMGTLVIPEGKYRIATPIRWDGRIGEAKHKALNIVGAGIGTQLVIEVGDLDAAMEFNGFEEVRLSGVTFVGVPGVDTDALQTVRLHNVHHAALVDCAFYGLSSLVADGSIVHAEGCDLLVERCTFRGCTTNSGHNAPIIDNDNWRGVVVRSTWFIDYGDLDGTYHSKTPMASSAGFVRLGEPSALDNALGQSEVVLDDVRVDEGCYRALFVHASSTVESVRVRGLRVNGNVAAGATAVHVQYTRRLLVESSWFGYRANDGGRAIGLLAVDNAALNDVQCVDGMDKITANAACGVLRINRCMYTTLESDAQDTVVT